MAAPKATTSSGLRLLRGVCPKKVPTACWMWGIRVAPPTIITPLISALLTPASFKACFTGSMVLATRCCVRLWNSCRVRVLLTLRPLDRVACSVVLVSVVRASLAARLKLSKSWLSCSFSCESWFCSSRWQNKRWSKSSPPNALLPPVAFTSNKPFDNCNTDTSNVPPPKSYTTNVPSEAWSKP